MASKQLQILFHSGRHLAEHHGLSHVIQHRQALHRQFFKHPVGQALKADNINIHHTVVRMQRHNLLLGLHGKLFRHQGKIAAAGICHGLADQILIQPGCLSRAGTSDDKL